MENWARNGVATIIGLLVLVVILWLGWGPVAGSVADSDSLPSGTDAAEELVGQAAVGLDDEALRKVAETEAARGNEPGAFFSVHLVQGETGEAIADQEVWYARSLGRNNSDRERVIKRMGKSVRSDANGIARIEDSSHSIFLYARKDHLVGSRWLSREVIEESGEDFATLELHPESIIYLRVIDAMGQPASGVWINISLLKEDLTRANRGWRAITDETGQVEWIDYGIFMRAAQETGTGPFGGLRAKASIPGNEQVILDIAPIPTHGQSFDLQIGNTGSLTVRYLDPDGNLLVGEHRMELRQLEVNEANGGWDKGPSHVRLFKEGIAVFPAVALDGFFELSPRSISWPRLRKVVFGPTSENPSVSVDLQLEDSRVILRGRALDGSGQPLSQTRLPGEVKTDKETFTYFADTDANGRFIAVFPAAVAGSPLTKANLEFRKFGPVDLLGMSPFRKGVTDIGEILFANQEMLVSGEVIASPDAACDSYGFRVDHRPPGSEKWQRLDSKAEKEGAQFSILGPLMEGEYRLQITTRERCFPLPEPIPFVPGQEGLRVELEAGHRLVAQAQMSLSAESLQTVPLSFILRPVSGGALERLSGTESRGVGGGWSRDGQETLLEINWQSLLPGGYELEVHFAGVQLPLETLQGIQIPGQGDLVTQPSLDLRDALRRYRLHLSTPDGLAPAAWTQVVLQLPGEKYIRAVSGGKPGENRVEVIAPPKTFDALVMTPGYLPVQLSALDRDQNVVLTASGLDLTLQLLESKPLPEGVGLKLHLESQEDLFPDWQRSADPSLGANWINFLSVNGHKDRNWPKSVSATFDSGGVASLTIHRAGPQTIRCELVPTTAERRANWPEEKAWIDGVVPARVAVGGSGRAQVLKISIPSAELELVLEKLGLR